MKTFWALTKRNVKVFFKDKGAFFSSLITPIILLVLYMTFLAKVYRDSFVSGLNGYSAPESLVNGTVAGQLMSSRVLIFFGIKIVSPRLFLEKERENLRFLRLS